MNKIKISPKGFTLIELLVVVLIIGILSAVALPAYRKAVEKSRVTDALSTMDAVAKSEHSWYLANNSYTTDFSDLDVSFIDKDANKAEDDSFETVNYTYELLDTGILASRNNEQYLLYKDYATNIIFCAPITNSICEEFSGIEKYLPRTVCERMDGVYHQTSSSCYENEQKMCQGINKPWQGEGEDGFCGYKDDSNVILDEGVICRGETYVDGTQWQSTSCLKATITDGGICYGMAPFSCNRPTIMSGGLCISEGQASCNSAIVDGGICRGVCGSSTLKNGGVCEGACANSVIENQGNCKGVCQYATIKNGGICTGSCPAPRVKDGGICYADSTKASCESYPNATGNNLANYEGSGCCCGSACSSKKATVNGVANQPVPICPESKCDPKYMK